MVVLARTVVQFSYGDNLDATVTQLVHPAPGNAAIGRGAVPAADIVNVIATRDAGPRGNTNRRRGIGILKNRPAGTETVQVWRLDNGMADAAHRVFAVLVRDNDQEIIARCCIHLAQFAIRRHGLAIAAARHALGGDGRSPSSMRWNHEIAVKVLGGDAAEGSQKPLDLAVAAVDRLDVQGASAHACRRGYRFSFRSPFRL